MKVNNKVVDKPNEILLVLPRTDGDLAFKFRAVTDSSPFEKMCPEPSPPKVTKKGGETYYNIEDPSYKQSLNEWASRQTHWQFLTSIAVTDGLEWDTVKIDDPGTWQNWRSDLTKAGFSIGEMNALWSHFVKANSLSSAMIDEARGRFLASQAQEAANLSSLTVAPSTLSSGVLANGSTSDHQESVIVGENQTNGQEPKS